MCIRDRSTLAAYKATDNRLAQIIIMGTGIGISSIVKGEADKKTELVESPEPSSINYHTNHAARIKSEPSQESSLNL